MFRFAWPILSEGHFCWVVWSSSCHNREEELSWVKESTRGILRYIQNRSQRETFKSRREKYLSLDVMSVSPLKTSKSRPRSQESGCNTKKPARNVQKPPRKCLPVDVMSVISLKTSKSHSVKSRKWMQHPQASKKCPKAGAIILALGRTVRHSPENIQSPSNEARWFCLLDRFFRRGMLLSCRNQPRPCF